MPVGGGALDVGYGRSASRRSAAGPDHAAYQARTPSGEPRVPVPVESRGEPRTQPVSPPPQLRQGEEDSAEGPLTTAITPPRRGNDGAVSAAVDGGRGGHASWRRVTA